MTTKQENLAKLRLDNPTLPKGELVALGGYGDSIIHTPDKVLESKGYKEALSKFGLTEELITTALVEDIQKKPQKRERELNLGSEILGMKKKDPDSGNPINIIVVNSFRETESK